MVEQVCRMQKALGFITGKKLTTMETIKLGWGEPHLIVDEREAKIRREQKKKSSGRCCLGCHFPIGVP